MTDSAAFAVATELHFEPSPAISDSSHLSPSEDAVSPGDPMAQPSWVLTKPDETAAHELPSPASSRLSPDSYSDDKSITTTLASARTRVTRRGHSKSRLGCFSCKRRRVKCNEVRPECGPCLRLGLSCVYPAKEEAPGSMQLAAVQSNPSAFTIEDLRFYHQFISAGFPTLPLKESSVWLQCAGMSYNHECLAHAILGLGASHLSQNCNVDYRAQALQHRLVAIQMVNKQLGNLPKTADEADALFASIVCLATQSSLMADSMVEYLTMVRGATIVLSTMAANLKVRMFKGFDLQLHVGRLADMVVDNPKDFDLIDGFRATVLSLEPLCQTNAELRYLDGLLCCADAVKISSHEAWLHFIPLYLMPSTFSNEDFAAFVDPENYTGQLLVIHMFLIDYLLGGYCLPREAEPKCSGRKYVVIGWVKSLAKTLPKGYQRHIQWAIQYCENLSHRDARYLLSL